MSADAENKREAATNDSDEEAMFHALLKEISEDAGKFSLLMEDVDRMEARLEANPDDDDLDEELGPKVAVNVMTTYHWLMTLAGEVKELAKDLKKEYRITAKDYKTFQARLAEDD